MSSGPEFEHVEQPLIDQLISMGWKYTTGNLDDPSVTARGNFREVLLLPDLRDALTRINLNDKGEPWLDDPRISQATSSLQRQAAAKLMEANRASTELLWKGTTVDGIEGWDVGRARTVHYIDWDNPENNTFRVINQFRVDEPGGQAHKFIAPDVVLFVNGIPLVVIECKSPYVSSPMESAVDQLQRYSNQRSHVEGNEGNERLFHTNQLVIGTHYDKARVGSVSSSAVHFLEWKDTSPIPMSEVAASLGKDDLSSQEKLVSGMLRPAHLLDIIRHFTLFSTVGSKTIKLVPRYQQFRAVQAATERLLTGKTIAEDGEHDRRGGIIWHTQGSGKSLTMVFLVRKLRSIPELRRFKVVVVTDRKDLQRQLSDTAALSGESVSVGKKTIELQGLLAQKGPGFVFGMIQKYQMDDGDIEVGDDGIPRDGDEGEFPVLNEDESILVLVDEAHRSNSSALHANLLKALPNCARIGFTGTPIIMGDKQRTHEIFGEFIDRYSIRQSEEDEATVPILYEGRTSRGAVEDGRDLDEVFEDMFQQHTDEELQAIKRKYATRGHVMEAPQLIADKVRDMLKHYVEYILPNGFKAQIVTISRRAAILYQESLVEAQSELVTKLESLDPDLLHLDDEEFAKLRPNVQFLVRAHPRLGILRELEFATIISGDRNDDPAWTEWTDSTKVAARTDRFKKPLYHEDPERRDPLAFLIVKSMLITGFDAPIEQVMYLDRPIREAELLQAIARVNRTHDKKKAGFVVDYYGVARHLKEALAAYDAQDIDGALRSLTDEIPKLRDRHKRVILFFEDQGIPDIDDQDACVEVLRDEMLRAQFLVMLKQFLETLDLVLPRPEGLPYVNDAKKLVEIQVRARNRFRGDERPIGKDVGDKVRKLIDDHLISKGVDPSIPPISITDAEFSDHVARQKSKRAQASEMEHAARSHIRKRLQEDPAYYESLSERLAEILEELKDRWDELVDALKDFVKEVQDGRQQDDTGLDPETQAPFLGVLRQEAADGGEISPEGLIKLCRVTVELVAHVQQEIGVVEFWSRTQAQADLRRWIFQFLDDQNVLPFDKLEEVADRLVQLAKVNHDKLTR
jgi:type I restriction enzyme, R subunit